MGQARTHSVTAVAAAVITEATEERAGQAAAVVARLGMMPLRLQADMAAVARSSFQDSSK
jgi:hypothetical protein